jgi:phosphate transport system protein
MDVDPTSSHAFEAQVRRLEHDILEMASLAEGLLAGAVDSLVRLDHEAALRVLRADDEIDEIDVAVETRILNLLSSRPADAADLRSLGTALKMITDIERVGDLAGDIAKCGMKIDKEMGESGFVDIPKLANLSRAVFMQSIEAFVKQDLALVRLVVQREAEVDAMYRDLREQVHAYMRAYPDRVVAASWMLLAVHHLERIADHALNIAGRVSYMITGELRRKHTLP